MPKIRCEDIEDYYCLYVLIFRVSEELFWDADIVFLDRVVEDKLAYENYIAYMRQER